MMRWKIICSYLLVVFIVKTAAQEPTVTPADEDAAKCMRDACVVGTITRLVLNSTDESIYKVKGEGPDATLSLPKGFTFELSDTFLQYHVWSSSHPNPKGISGGVSGSICQLIPSMKRGRNSMSLRNRVDAMLFDGIEGCVDEPTEYRVPMEYKGLFSYSRRPISCKPFELMVTLARNYSGTPDLTMVVSVVADNALSCSREEETTLAPTTGKPSELGTTADPGSQPESTSEPPPQVTSVTPAPESKPESESEAIPVSEPTLAPTTEEPNEPTSNPEPDDDPEPETQPESTSEPPPQVTSVTPAPESKPESEPQAKPKSEQESEAAAADSAKCMRDACVVGTITRLVLNSTDESIYKVKGEGPDATLSLPKGFTFELSDTFLQYHVWSSSHPNPKGISGGVSGSICQLIPSMKRGRNSMSLRNRVDAMLFDGIEGCVDEPTEYRVPMEYKGLFSYSRRPISCKPFELMVTLARNYSGTPDLTMVVSVVADNALSCSREEETTLAPTTGKPNEPGTTADPGSQPESTSEPPPQVTSVTPAPESKPESEPEAIPVSEPTLASATEEPNEPTSSPEPETQPESTSEPPPQVTSVTPAPESKPESEPQAKPKSEQESEAAAADSAKCMRDACVVGTITRLVLNSTDESIYKVKGEGPDATLSLPKGFTFELSDTFLQYHVWSSSHPNPKGISGGVSGSICQLIPSMKRGRNSMSLRNRVDAMLFDGIEGCVDEPTEYRVPMEYKGLFSYSRRPISCKPFELMVTLARNYSGTPDLTMVVSVVADNALSCSREEETTLAPTTGKPSELGTTADPGSQPESTSEPPPQITSVTPAPESKSESESEAIPVSEPTLAPTTEEPNEPTSNPEPDDDPEPETQPESTPEPPPQVTSVTPAPESKPESESEAIPVSEPTLASTTGEPNEPTSNPEPETQPESTSEPPPQVTSVTPAPESKPESESEAIPVSEPTLAPATEEPNEPTSNPEPDDDPEPETQPESTPEPPPQVTSVTPAPESKPESEPGAIPESEPTLASTTGEPNEPTSNPEPETQPESTSEPPPQVTSVTPAPESKPESEPGAIPESEPTLTPTTGEPNEPTSNPAPETEPNPEVEISTPTPESKPEPEPVSGTACVYNPEPNSEPEMKPEPRPVLQKQPGKSNCDYFKWLATQPNEIPDVTVYYEWLTGNGCIPKPNYPIIEDTLSQSYSWYMKGRSGAISAAAGKEPRKCNYYKWLRNYPDYIPSVAHYYEWLLKSGCVPAANHPIIEGNLKGIKSWDAKGCAGPDARSSVKNSGQCDYFKLLIRNTEYVPKVDVYYEWLLAHGCVLRANYPIIKEKVDALNILKDAGPTGIVRRRSTHCDYIKWLSEYPDYVPDVVDYYKWVIHNGCFYPYNYPIIKNKLAKSIEMKRSMPTKTKQSKNGSQRSNCDYFKWLTSLSSRPTLELYNTWVYENGCFE